jgi:hypothetical protein
MFENPVRCLACGELYEGAGIGGMPGMCPRRYLTPHTEGFMRPVAEVLDPADRPPPYDTAKIDLP